MEPAAPNSCQDLIPFPISDASIRHSAVPRGVAFESTVRFPFLSALVRITVRGEPRLFGV